MGLSGSGVPLWGNGVFLRWTASLGYDVLPELKFSARLLFSMVPLPFSTTPFEDDEVWR
jgi:hypothetical protein